MAAVASFAAYALPQNGHPGHPLVAAVFGSPTDAFALHRFAFGASVARDAWMPTIGLCYGLADVSGRLCIRRQVAVTGFLAVLAVLVAIRLLP